MRVLHALWFVLYASDVQTYAQVGMDDVNAGVVDHGTKPPREGMMKNLGNNRVVQALTYVRIAQGGPDVCHVDGRVAFVPSAAACPSDRPKMIFGTHCTDWTRFAVVPISSPSAVTGIPCFWVRHALAARAGKPGRKAPNAWIYPWP